MSHLNQHWQLLKKAKKIQSDSEQYLELKRDIFDFLLFWLKDHILGTDKLYFGYLLKNKLL